MRDLVIKILAFVTMLVVAACGGSGNGSSSSESFVPKSFPNMPSAPKALTQQEDISKYIANHYWDKYLSEYSTYPTDSTMVLGVRNDDLEYAVGTYVTLLENALSTKDGQQAVKILFDQIESFEAGNPSSGVFEKMVEFVSKYLYDPNSPVRSEDLYLPFVERLAESSYTNPDMVPAYSFDARMCSLNQEGTKAADFVFTDLSGKRHSLYGIKAEYTLLFFSNPGCPSCQEIIEAISMSQAVSGMINSGQIAVVNIYIDQEVDLWKDYASGYPKTWYNGYDHKYNIRTDTSYNVRAIPSLYILDKDKLVIMKDAPQDKVLHYLNSIARN